MPATSQVMIIIIHLPRMTYTVCATRPVGGTETRVKTAYYPNTIMKRREMAFAQSTPVLPAVDFSLDMC